MPNPLRLVLTALCLVALCLATSGPVAAQPEIVPAEHPVYDWLHAQRLAGRLPEYRHEALPMGRADVQRHLDSLSTQAVDAGRSMAYWLGEYRREFFEPEGGIESVFGRGGLQVPRLNDTEKFLFHHQSADWRIALQAIGRLQFRHSEGLNPEAPRPAEPPLADSLGPYSGAAFVPEGVLQGNYRGRLGFYTSTFDGQQFGGDTRVLQSDPELASLYYVGLQRQPAGSFDRATASLRAAGRVFSAEIAHARLRYGASFAQPLVLAENADYFSFVRLGLDTRVVQYQFVHGALGDRSFNALPDSGFVLVGPERYLAIHRLTLQPSRRLSFAFTEMVVYGQRGPELAYLNPLNPFKPAEHAQWDRDNSLFALDAVWRPLDGIEAYGTFLADDLDFSELGQNSYNNKWAAQAGAAFSAERLLPGALAFVEYTRILPFVYTHRFRLDGSFYNAYQHNGFSLGHPLGPNAEQFAGGVQLWLPFRARLRAVARYARRGENYFDEDGTLVNVGGSQSNGDQPSFEEPTNVFLRGERFAGPGLALDVAWEPVRGAALRLLADYQRWDRDPDRTFVRAELAVSL